MPLPNASSQERSNLALDVLNYCNMFPRLWEGRHPWVLGQLLHKITDPREQEPLTLPRGTRLIAAIKKDKVLWARVSPFTQCNSWNAKCKCKHYSSDHRGIGKACLAVVNRYDHNSPRCKCLHYEERGL